MSRSAALASATAIVLLTTAVTGSAAALAVSGPGAAAPAGPGAASYFDEARKDCLGTAENTKSKVWYTVADGVLSTSTNPPWTTPTCRLCSTW